MQRPRPIEVKLLENYLMLISTVKSCKPLFWLTGFLFFSHCDKNFYFATFLLLNSLYKYKEQLINNNGSTKPC